MFLLRRHMSFYLAAIGGAAAFIVSWLLKSPLAPVIGANTFFVLYLALTLTVMPKLTAAFLKKHAASTDEPAWIIFLVTFATVIVAVVSLFIVVNRHPQADSFTLVTTLASVPLGWATIHMLTAIHYAHAYWQPRDPAGDDSSHASRYRGGFDFPGTPEPSGWDFAYYAYVIGMTAQTSDTSVTTTTMRRLTLMHSVVSYFFNTILVAAAVNAAVALGS
ncbi:DUF1345 domain-containing protein [Brucella tritici]|uniref:DUF1345 domain-containing protein n=1 Tax=Brucella tritici TaxID=94626 RepID=A0A833CNS1_9HYPH|nr:DUF1345 domain-containing protein [Brucella tritici]MBA8817783.1 putative membrane protein [Ochrobactrum sp. P6BSIII]MDH7784461.1 putative membrane protein [Ochrobactrum sp. 19YEA23]OOL16171.1 hypothetical protein BRY73_15660 [Ochrobactrum sp. P6BS-III]KAB2666382.1 DUF1345 domain-containing protein [Brucella tritici]KAB2677185.1 DUF1345 domain-containing protein [Brucella tritici]